MKKIKLLAPLFGAATVAATTIPMVSCGQSDTTIIMKKTEDNADYFLFKAENIQLKKDTLYTIVADLSKVTNVKEAMMFVLEPELSSSNSSEEIATPTFTKVIVNNQTLKESSIEEAFIECGWIYYPEGGLVMFAKDGSTFKVSGKVQISFKVDKDIDKINFAFGNDQ